MNQRGSRASRAEAVSGHAYRIRDVPIGLAATGTRRETDSMGAIDVPADRYWGAQTQRSLIHFSIGDDRMPKAVYHAYGCVKKAAAIANGQAGRLPAWKADLIARVADEVIAVPLTQSVPLPVQYDPLRQAWIIVSDNQNLRIVGNVGPMPVNHCGTGLGFGSSPGRRSCR
jgi:fumarate hydratase, class II